MQLPVHLWVAWFTPCGKIGLSVEAWCWLRTLKDGAQGPALQADMYRADTIGTLRSFTVQLGTVWCKELGSM